MDATPNSDMVVRKSPLEKSQDKATSILILDCPTWSNVLEMCKQIKRGNASPKDLVNGLTRGIKSPFRRHVIYNLLMLEYFVKSCGSIIHDEIGMNQYMKQLKELIKYSPHVIVKLKLLELIQAWAFAFRNSPKYRVVQDTVNMLKAEGYTFPVLKKSDAMFIADSEWAQGYLCHYCRVPLNGETHRFQCHVCGQAFCGRCVSIVSIWLKIGIEKKVHICAECYDKVTEPNKVSTGEIDLLTEYLASSMDNLDRTRQLPWQRALDHQT